MPLKHDWEKADAFIALSPEIIHGMVALALPHLKLAHYTIIAGGCANLNIKLEFVDSTTRYILRVYMREREAVYREQKIAQLLKGSVPVPQIYFVGDYDGYRFAIIEHMYGITLRDLILNHPHEDYQCAVAQAGELLAKFKHIVFDKPGLLDQHLNVIAPLTANDYVHDVHKYVKDPVIINQLGDKKIAQIMQIMSLLKAYLPAESDHTLVHGDYEPSNILVDAIDGRWQITAVLDCEFVFSGSWLWDVAHMIRYADQLPAAYEESFLKGISQTGLILPEQWRITAHLLNMISLLKCLTTCDPIEHPHQAADVRAMIVHILKALENTKHIMPV